MKQPFTHSSVHEFEQLYIRLREKEGRLYTDEEVAKLPLIDGSHPHHKEWKTRSASLKKLLQHIKRTGSNLNILEVGCGNGWLSAKLAAYITGKMTGTDINKTELDQAIKVFHQQQNLEFINCALGDAVLDDKKFDLIIFAASIQYFPSLKEIVDTALDRLSANGEIYILDSHFYKQAAIAAARQRTRDYYATMAFDVLANYYHHHSIEGLARYDYKILQDPYSWKNKLTFNKNPFHQIVIKKTNL